MGGGIAHFGRKGHKSPKIEKNGQKFSTYGPRGTAHRGPRGAAPKDLEARRRASRSIGTKYFYHFFLQFRWFLTPPTKMSCTPHCYPKYEMIIIWRTVPLIRSFLYSSGSWRGWQWQGRRWAALLTHLQPSVPVCRPDTHSKHHLRHWDVYQQYLCFILLVAHIYKSNHQY